VPGKGTREVGRRRGREVTPVEIARSLFSLALALIPHEEAKALLDDEARKRVDLLSDAAELAKFGPRP
jgi:hypothetical protein